MQTVSRFEANLLTLLSFFLRREPAERALPLVEQGQTQPPCLSRGAVRLVRDALAKGCVCLLAERGGWRRERFLRDGRPVEGRLWERTPPEALGLTFTRQTLEFLRWVTAVKPGVTGLRPHLDVAQATDGDRLLLFFAHEGLRQYDGKALDWQSLPGFADHGLCRLVYPDDFARSALTQVPDFVPWMTGVGAAVLEALQNDLAARWVEVECGKQHVTDHATMRQLGEEQERVLTAFLSAAEQAGRLDLARFVLRAAAQLLPAGAEATFWVRALQHGKHRLAERSITYALALTFVRNLSRLQAWTRTARSIGYFDEGYEAAQLWLAAWEQNQGDVLMERAQAVIRQRDPLRQT